MHDVLVEGLVEAGGPCEIPGMDDDVAEHEGGDRVVEPVGPGPGMGDLRGRNDGVVQHGLEAEVQGVPRRPAEPR